MSYQVKEHEYLVAVTGEAALPNANRPDDDQFIPDFARIKLYEDNFDMWITGPLLNPRTGMPFKTKRGMASYWVEDIVAGRVPAWVSQVVNETVGESRLRAVAALMAERYRQEELA